MYITLDAVITCFKAKWRTANIRKSIKSFVCGACNRTLTVDCLFLCLVKEPSGTRYSTDWDMYMNLAHLFIEIHKLNIVISSNVGVAK